eukprot:GFUD01024087.1.p1 GENE.GFUD01024087.1~~GFUD01024087.1.p1  ORF type:complete len:469 (+),score=121.47 GFUD01024087.1:48-1409(+)
MGEQDKISTLEEEMNQIPHTQAMMVTPNTKQASEKTSNNLFTEECDETAESIQEQLSRQCTWPWSDFFDSKVAFQTSLPAPLGPFQVGYLDLMTPGLPQDSSLLRIYYPAPSNTSITSPPLWADKECRAGMLRFIQSAAWDWPTWVNNSEFNPLFAAKKILLSPAGFLTGFSLGWPLIGTVRTIPIARAAPLAPHVGSGWPVVVFSHGMGCNRFNMSQLCYQLASQGVMVVAVEHREGSGFGTFYMNGDTVENIPHLQVPVDENEYRVRNKQINHRCEEVLRAIDLLVKINAGEAITNVIDKNNNAVKSDLTILKSSMDLTNNLYLAGHSFGGSTVLLASSLNTKVKAVFAMDPWMYPLAEQKFEIAKPTLIVNTDIFVNPNNLKVINEASKNNSDVTFEVLEGGVHLSPTDLPMAFPTVLRKVLGMKGTVDAEVTMVEINKIVWQWLKNLIS